MTLLWKWLLSALSLLVVAYLLPGFQVESFYFALIAALVLGLANLTIRPIILLFTLPINFITLGLFTFVVNAFILWFVASFLEGFTIHGFTTAILAAIILWLFNIVIDQFFLKKASGLN